MTVPQPLVPQHMQALANANDLRLRRAALKRDIRTRTRPEAFLAVGRMILDPPHYLEGMAIKELLGACRRTGPKISARMLGRLHISEGRRIGELTARQRHVLAVVLGAADDVPAESPILAASAVEGPAEHCPRCNTTVVTKPERPDVCPWCDAGLIARAA